MQAFECLYTQFISNPLWNDEPMELPVHLFSHASMIGQS